MKCPSCKKSISERIAGIWPFCSKRCKMLDFGKWVKEDYRISGSESEQVAKEASTDIEGDS